MRYGKLTDSVLIYAPRAITVGQTHYNPASAEMLTEMGYLPVENTPMPEIKDGYTAVGSWVKGDGKILRKWTLKADEELVGS